MAAIKPGGILVNFGLMDAAGELNFRKLTLFEITLIGDNCNTPAGMRAAAIAIENKSLGDLSWVETRPLSEVAQAFRDLDEGHTGAAPNALFPARTIWTGTFSCRETVLERWHENKRQPHR